LLVADQRTHLAGGIEAGRELDIGCHLRLTPSTTWSKTFSCAYRREPAQQHWPWLKKMALAEPETACSIGASGKMSTGDFPPSSRVTFLEVAGSGFDDELAHLSGAGEGDFIDKIVGSERRASAFAIAGEDVDDAGREAGFVDELGQAQAGERGLLG
jgi:hypothetical protein